MRLRDYAATGRLLREALKKLFEDGYVPTEGMKRPSEQQLRFLVLPNQEAFYGGAAGGGKSDAIAMGALMFCWIPGYAAIIFRRKLTDHEGADGLELRLKKWLQPMVEKKMAEWRASNKTWYFPYYKHPNPATVRLGGLKDPGSELRFQSQAFQYIGFDELTHFLETQFIYMTSRLRKPGAYDEFGVLENPLGLVPLRIRSASNPGGDPWVKQRYVDQTTSQHPFIPARVQDNPGLNVEEYIKTLSGLPPVLRQQLLEGDWNVRAPGSMFDKSWIDLSREFPHLGTAVRYWDMAATKERVGYDPSWTCGTLLAYDGIRTFYVLDVKRVREGPKGVEDLVKKTAWEDKLTYLDTARLRYVHTYMETEPGSAGKIVIDHFAGLLVGFPFWGDRVTGSKYDRASPVSAAAERREIKIHLDEGRRLNWLPAWYDELEAFPETKHKDQVDSLSGAFNKLVFQKRPPKAR